MKYIAIFYPTAMIQIEFHILTECGIIGYAVKILMILLLFKGVSNSHIQLFTTIILWIVTRLCFTLFCILCAHLCLTASVNGQACQ